MREIGVVGSNRNDLESSRIDSGHKRDQCPQGGIHQKGGSAGALRQAAEPVRKVSEAKANGREGRYEPVQGRQKGGFESVGSLRTRSNSSFASNVDKAQAEPCGIGGASGVCYRVGARAGLELKLVPVAELAAACRLPDKQLRD